MASREGEESSENGSMIYLYPALRSRLAVSCPEPPASWSEGDLAQWWQSLQCGDCLETFDGPPIYLLEGGRINAHEGPDIQGARIVRGSRIMEGDVEFHLRENDWFLHGHDKDPRYDAVVLHVSSWLGRRRAVSLSGHEIPLVMVSLEVPTFSPESTCQLSGVLNEETVLEKLESLARIRWIRKVHEVRDILRTTEDIREAFYQRTFWALGLKGNEHLFTRLAESIPLGKLQSLEDQTEVYLALQGGGGLLPGTPFKRVGYLRAWRDLARSLDLKEVVSPHEWHRKGLRPKAFPEGRLMFGAKIVRALLQGWRPWDGSFEATYSALETLFDGNLPGRGWCGEWIGNVILPFQGAWSLRNDSRSMSERFAQWHTIALGYSYGKLSRRFSNRISGRQLSNFMVQQGLLILQEWYCSTGLCRLCALRR